MNVGRTKNILDKINHLMSSIAMSDNDVSALEKDLLLSYVRDLYDSVLTSSNSPNNQSIKQKVETSLEQTKEIINEHSSIEVESNPNQEDNIPSLSDLEANRHLQEQIHVHKQMPVSPVPAPPSSQTSVVTQIEPEPLPQAAPESQREDQQSTDSNPHQQPDQIKKINHLFEVPEARDLSSKLGEGKITDLHKAVGINEKLLLINKLFNRDHILYNDTIRRINSMQDYQEAKQFLMSQIALDQNWEQEDKQDIAKSFIKLVRRKFKSLN